MIHSQGLATVAMLSRRQARLYTDSVMVFPEGAASFVIEPTTGNPLPCSGDQNRRGPYPAKFVYTENVDDAMGVSRIKRFNMDTADYLHTEVGTPIGNADWVLNVTRLADGSRHPNYGQLSRVLGAPRVIPGGGRRMVNLQSVRLMQEEIVPDSVAIYLTGHN